MRAIALALSLVLSFMIPWEGVIEFAGLGNGSKAMGFVLAAFWLMTVVITGRFRKPSLFQIMICFFVLWNAVSIFWSADSTVTAGHVFTWVQLFLLAFIWWDLYTTQTAILAGLEAYVLGAYVAIGGAIANFFAGNAFYTHYDRYSPGETNPDGFGFVMALGLPVAWYLAASQNTSRMSSFWKLINYAYIPAAMLGIALSGTRTASIAAVPGMMFGLTTLTRVRPLARVAIFLFFTGAVVFLLPYVETERSFQRFSTTASELTEGDLNNRTNIWLQGLATFAEHPILGIGGNMFPSINRWDKAAHNSFLAILVELGLIGFAIFALILVVAVTKAWNHPAWESRFWLTTLFVWAIGASTLTWGHRKPTWLFLNMVVASAALVGRRGEEAPIVQRTEPMVQAGPHTKQHPWRHNANEKPHLV
jgi:O-antigen ligase